MVRNHVVFALFWRCDVGGSSPSNVAEDSSNISGLYHVVR